jgi:hypothetical protein
LDGKKGGGCKVIKVVFNRKYSFKAIDDRVCEVEVVLPADEGGYLIPELRDSKSVVLGWELTKTWGHYDRETNTRYYSLRVSGATWDEVEREADELVNDALEQLRRVYKKNMEELKKAPRDKEEVYYLEE